MRLVYLDVPLDATRRRHAARHVGAAGLDAEALGDWFEHSRPAGLPGEAVLRSGAEGPGETVDAVMRLVGLAEVRKVSGCLQHIHYPY